MSFESPLLKVSNLTIGFGGNEPAISDISFELHRGETIGIVGESGSGKSLTSLAIMGLLPKNADILSGEISFQLKEKSANLLALSETQMRGLRGKRIAMIFQEPMTSLNPSHTCGNQVAEMLITHEKISKAEARTRVVQLFEEVLLPRPAEIYDSYPHQISGGQKQRVMIAMALSCQPDLIIADEPTTALDVTVQKQILVLLRQLCERRNTGLIFITHDLGVVAEVSNSVLVMYRGKVLEQGEVKDLFKNPKHPYTKALIACRPRLDASPERLPVVDDFLNPRAQTEHVDDLKPSTKALNKEALVQVKNLQVSYVSERDWLGKPKRMVHAVDNVSFDVLKGETLGLVGESGCGKSTLGRTLLRLIKPQSGEILYKGKDISQLPEREIKPLRNAFQLIFQDPYSSLNPRMTVQQMLLEPMQVHNIGKKEDRLEAIKNIIEKVGLTEGALKKYPHEFSGGQRQRICIARALVLKPEFIVCDESVSALDVSVQAMVLNLLNDLKDEFGLTYIFISHDLSVVKYMSDRLIVMRAGKIEEMGDSEAIYKNPQSEYTRTLIDAIPAV
jgi:peptide/nickel transport system ATP-binding protein